VNGSKEGEKPFSPLSSTLFFPLHFAASMPQPRTPATTLPWPTIPPPHSPLSLTPISPGIQIIDSFFSSKTLSSFISFLSTSTQITWVSPSPPKKGEATRTNHRFSIQDSNFARELWERSGLKDVCQRDRGLEGKNGRKPVGLNSNIRCYRYEKGSFFGRMFLGSNLTPCSRTSDTERR